MTAVATASSETNQTPKPVKVTLEIAKEVLNESRVSGGSISKLAEARGLNPQYVHNAISRMKKIKLSKQVKGSVMKKKSKTTLDTAKISTPSIDTQQKKLNEELSVILHKITSEAKTKSGAESFLLGKVAQMIESHIQPINLVN